MKCVVHAVFGLSLLAAAPAFAASVPTAAQAAVTGPAHVQAVQDLLGAMQVEKVLRGVAARSRFPSQEQRQAVFAKLDKLPATEVYRRLAPQLVQAISADTAIEMTRFYGTPYGKQVIYKRYNHSAQFVDPYARPSVAPEEKKERKRAAYVLASKELAAAEPSIEREAFKLLQTISREK
ncbi:hypothetical protein G4G28_02285 [Massilia sp. Dwa41.01b]|uniref:hypothetical protein n=1 Tax=unclassified Massilia TaxID=2609279 RepID=UPI0016002138|nr:MULTISPECIES: hypothetical protein [unclassified Massilia]QNA87587.1 hypothetical protein G4G28_02285 [Massilia sp. Dwa41.01b]QNA98490.1 hypothetical protein G4G31_06030 [Massilia sp. Se16.2.3]